MIDELLLTSREHQNYQALTLFLQDIPHPERVGKRKRSYNESFKKKKKLERLQQQDFCCLDCGCRFVEKQGTYSVATTEHIIPYRYGGTHSQFNSVLVCHPCNLARDMLPKEKKIELIQEHYGSIGELFC